MTTESRQPPVPSNSPNPELARKIAEKSPEGVPGMPDAGPRKIGLMLALAIIGLLTVAVLLAAFVSPIGGVSLGAVAIVFFLANPAVWTAIQRADERRKIADDEVS
jgi:hypothetical protein